MIPIEVPSVTGILISTAENNPSDGKSWRVTHGY